MASLALEEALALESVARAPATVQAWLLSEVLPAASA
jgi:prophage antirepressor-like protein